MSSMQIQQKDSIHILVVGAGAVGCFYASKLHHPEEGVYVSLVCRSNYKSIAEKGVQLKTRDFGDYHFQPYKVFASIEDAAPTTSSSSSSSPSSSSSSSSLPRTQGIWDYVIVTTKALPDRVDDSISIQAVVSPGPTPGTGTTIALIQNGVGIESPHRQRYPNNPIVSCVTVISAEQVSHGVVVQNRWTRISLGPYSDGVGHPDDSKGQGLLGISSNPTDSTSTSSSSSDLALLSRASTSGMQALQSWWSKGGIKDAEAHTEKELQLIRWHKLTINASMNPSAVLSGGTGNADMVLLPELRLHIRGVMEEIFFLAPRILDIPQGKFPHHLGLASADQILKSTERNRGAKPSMLLDWQAGRPMELEVILGNPVRMARQKGLPCPRLQSMYALLKAAQDRREEEQKGQQRGGDKKSKL